MKPRSNSDFNLEQILRDGEHEEHVRVTIYVSKVAFVAFKKKCRGLPVSRAFDAILRRLTQDEPRRGVNRAAL